MTGPTTSPRKTRRRRLLAALMAAPLSATLVLVPSSAASAAGPNIPSYPVKMDDPSVPLNVRDAPSVEEGEVVGQLWHNLPVQPICYQEDEDGDIWDFIVHDGGFGTERAWVADKHVDTNSVDPVVMHCDELHELSGDSCSHGIVLQHVGEKVRTRVGDDAKLNVINDKAHERPLTGGDPVHGLGSA